MTRLLWYVTLAGALARCCPAQSPLDQVIHQVENSTQPAATDSSQPGQTTPPAGLSLSDSKISDGLKAALTKGTASAVASTGRPDGFFKNEAIKILVPSHLQSIAKGMRAMGMGAPVDELELSMNRAAEKAAPAAKPIFIDAITKMSFSDVRKILTGGNTAATDYFKQATSPDLTKAFAPVVHQSMEDIGLIKQYDDFVASTPVAGFMGSNESFNLDGYVVGKALDGLFYELAAEEKKIRTNPAAQTTTLLKEVFGKL